MMGVAGPAKLRQTGMALLLVVSVISLLVVVVLQFSTSMSNALIMQGRHQERSLLSARAESGLEIGLALLYTDRLETDYDTLVDNWSIATEEPLPIALSQGDIELEVIDLSGRLAINSLVDTGTEGTNPGGQNSGVAPEEVQEMLLRLLVNGPFAIEDEQQAREVVDSLVDWLDSDDEDSPYGAESSYYEALAEPYGCRNGLVQSIEELLLIKGVSAELLYGNDENSALADYITVHGTAGQININTASYELFQALDERIAPEHFEALDEFRTVPENIEALAQSGWYKTVAGWPGDITITDEWLTTKTTFFELKVLARYRENSLRLVAVVERPDDTKMEILFRKIE